MERVRQFDEESDSTQDECHVQAERMARILTRYREYLSRDLHGSILADRLKNIITADEYHHISHRKAGEDRAQAAISLVIKHLESGITVTFDRMLSVLDDLASETAGILRERKTNSVRNLGLVELYELETNTEMNKRKVECYVETLTQLRKFRVPTASLHEMLRVIDSEPYETKYDVVFKFETDPFGCLLDCMIHELTEGLHGFYDRFIRAISVVDHQLHSEMKKTLECQFALFALKTNMSHLIDLDIRNTLRFIQPSLSSDEADRISGYKGAEKTSAFINCIVRRLYAGEITLFEKFVDALAGLHPIKFRFLKDRSPTVEEAEACIRAEIDDLKTLIIQTGHQTDKDSDKTIHLEKNYVKLRVKPLVEQVSAKSPAVAADNQHPMIYQSTLSGGDRDIEDVIEGMESKGQLFLVQGRCGIGKTTMTQHLCMRWAKGKCLKKFSCLFLIHIRRLLLFNCKQSLADLLTRNSLYQNNLPSKWVENWPNQVLVNLDGLDELGKFAHKMKYARVITDIHEEALPEELIVNILRRNLLPKATVTCTSRPFEALDTLKPDQDLEIMGLTKEGVLEYVEKNVAPENQIKVKSTLENNPVLMSVCSITYYACTLSIVLARNKVLSTKDIDTYSRLTAYIIKSYPERGRDDSVERRECEASFPVLSDIALQAGQQKGREGDLKAILIDLDDIEKGQGVTAAIRTAQDIGLLQITKVKYGKYCKTVLEFPHLSLQEFFAAVKFLRISKSSKVSVEKELSVILKTGSLNMFQLFIFGVALDAESKILKHMRTCILGSKGTFTEKTKKHICKAFESVISRNMTGQQLLKVCQIAYEAKCGDLADIVCTKYLHKEDNLSIQTTPLNALDIKSLMFVISHSNLKHIKLSNVNLDSYSLVIMDVCLREYQALKSLNLSHNQIKEEGLAALSKLLETHPGLEELDLTGNAITSSSFEKLLPGLKMKRAAFGFYIGENHIQDKGAEGIALALINTNRVTALDVCHNGIGLKGMAALGVLIRQSGSNSILKFDGNTAGEAFIQSLFANSDFTGQLKSLSLNDTLVTNAGVNLIAGNIHRFANSCSISLSDCQIGTECARNLIDEVSGTKIHLDLQNNHINFEMLFGRGKIVAKSWQSRGKIPGSRMTTKNRKTTIELSGNIQGSQCVRRILDKFSRGKEFYSLDLSDCKIRDEDVRLLVKAFMGNNTLQKVHLQYNNITDNILRDLSCLVFTCPHISKINLWNTKVNEESQRMFLHISIEQYAALDLSGHRINDSGIDCLRSILSERTIKLSCLTLNNCGVNENRCRLLGSALEKNNTIKEFNLANNVIGYEGASAIAKALTQNSSLEMVDISENMIGDEGAKSLGAALAESSSLLKINLGLNSINVDGGKAIATALAQNPSLYSIDLGCNCIGDGGATAIVAALAKNSSLTQLDLRSNGIGAKGAKAIASVFRRNSSLSRISLLDNGIGAKGGEAIGEALAQNSSLTMIDLGSNALGAKGGKAIAAALKLNSSLTQINLSDNGIGPEGGKAIGDALARNSSLTQIDLGKNGIGVEGGKAIAAVLAANSTLTQIDLESNDIGDIGGSALAAALTLNTSVTHISLWHNRLGAEAGIAIAGALRQNSSLTQIDLGGNHLGDKGAKAISDALTVNSSLSRINLWENGIGADGGKAIGEALEENSSLAEINLWANRIGDEGGNAIAAALGKNTSLIHINIRDNGIGPEVGKVMASVQNASLTHIDIRGNFDFFY